MKVATLPQPCALSLCAVLSIFSAVGCVQTYEEAALRTRIANFDSEVGDVEQRAHKLRRLLHQVAVDYDRARADYVRAADHLAARQHNYDVAKSELESAIEDYNTATWIWRFDQVLMLALTVAQLPHTTTASVKQAFECTPMSNQQFRRLKQAQGYGLLGKEDDHIVPLALGGTHHPLNQRLVDRAVNRAWGATWNAEKCTEVGAEACALAIAVSVICGSFQP